MQSLRCALDLRSPPAPAVLRMLLLIDNYDSFTFNLVHYLGDLGARCHVVRNDQITVDQALSMGAQGIVISPGPCDPDRAGICLDLVRAASGRLPILGVCLGHQTIGQVFGGTVVRAPQMMHGKISAIRHTDQGLFKGLPNPMRVTRYHSLTIDPGTVPDCLTVTAHADDGLVMGLSHRTWPIHGVQFHPESIASEAGHALLSNFMTTVTQRDAA